MGVEAAGPPAALMKPLQDPPTARGWQEQTPALPSLTCPHHRGLLALSPPTHCPLTCPIPIRLVQTIPPHWALLLSPTLLSLPRILQTKSPPLQGQPFGSPHVTSTLPSPLGHLPTEPSENTPRSPCREAARKCHVGKSHGGASISVSLVPSTVPGTEEGLSNY